MTDFDILGIQQRIAPLRKSLLQHEIYKNLKDEKALQTFMEYHVFAVWDFMVLLKGLQRRLTSVEETWRPSTNRVARRLINDIVLAEESDLDINGEPSSHFEMYLDAMKEAGADTFAINHLVKKLSEGYSHKSIAKHNIAELNQACLNFIRATYEIVKNNKAHEIAAAFTFGREDLIPDLFSSIVKDLNQSSGRLSAFVYYLDRHIELDGDEHGPMAHKMIRNLCEHDQLKWQEAGLAAEKALQARLAFWDAINQAVLKNTALLSA